MSRHRDELERLKAEIPELQIDKIIGLGASGAAGMAAFMLAMNGPKSELTEAAEALSILKDHIQLVVTEIGDNHVALDALAAALTVIAYDQTKKFQGNKTKLLAVTAGLMKLNEDRSNAINTVREIAKARWDEDTQKKIRTSEMAEIIWGNLLDEGKADFLPQDKARLKAWIRPIAPEHAKAKGRPRKMDKS